jgi:hypothetical protein
MIQNTTKVITKIALKTKAIHMIIFMLTQSCMNLAQYNGVFIELYDPTVL